MCGSLPACHDFTRRLGRDPKMPYRPSARRIVVRTSSSLFAVGELDLLFTTGLPFSQTMTGHTGQGITAGLKYQTDTSVITTTVTTVFQLSTMSLKPIHRMFQNATIPCEIAVTSGDIADSHEAATVNTEGATIATTSRAIVEPPITQGSQSNMLSLLLDVIVLEVDRHEDQRHADDDKTILRVLKWNTSHLGLDLRGGIDEFCTY